MARGKKELSAEGLDSLAERAQDLALDITHSADLIRVTDKRIGLMNAASKFNQLAEAATKMNRMLLAIATLAEDKWSIEEKFSKKDNP